MTLPNTKYSNIIDYLISIFFILFLVSLTNSIFVNQLGYYGTLLLLLVKSFIIKENGFSKIGLELPLLLFMLAEVLSTFFSIDSAASFQNLLKRVLLLPVIYVTVAVINDSKKFKMFFNIFIIAAVVTILLYILFAYNHFIDHLYQIEARGPSPFQYVMTAGGLISIVVVYLFSLIFNKDQKNGYLLFYIFGFVVSLIALLASYTRAAWLGALSGILIVLILRKKWIVIFPLIIIFIAAVFLSKNDSKVLVYKIDKDKLIVEKEIQTKGRASDVLIKSNSTLIADYENGIFELVENKLKKILDVPAPVVKIEHWQNYFLARLIDARMLLIEEKLDNTFEIIKEFTSIGDTKATYIYNDNLFVADFDSGLTIFHTPNNVSDYSRYPNLLGIRSFVVTEQFLISHDKNRTLRLYKRGNNSFTKVDSFKTYFERVKLWYKNNFLFTQLGASLKQFKLEQNKFNDVKEYLNFQQIAFMKDSKEKILLCNMDGKLYETELINNQLVKEKSYNIGYLPSGIAFSDSLIIASSFTRNRLTSIIDPYHSTNIQRMNQWKVGYKIWKDYPLFGVGDIDLHKLYGEYKEYYEKETFGHLHNNYVHLIIILGTFGFLVVVYLFIKILLIHFNILNKCGENDFAKSISVGTIAVFIAFLVSGLAEWNFGDHEIITMIWFSTGLNIASFRVMNKK